MVGELVMGGSPLVEEGCEGVELHWKGMPFVGCHWRGIGEYWGMDER